VFFDLHRQRQLLAVQRDELEAAGRALRIADQHKDRFLAMLAHELFNPIAAIKAGLHLLTRREGTDEAAPIRDQMDRQIVHLTRLVEDLLDISRVSEGKISLRKERVELHAIVRSAIEASQNNLDAGRHRFTLALPEREVWFEADAVRIVQVVSNLLNNAAKYTPEGGDISLTAEALPDAVEIRVTDDGVGIPVEMQARIFHIFEQVSGHRNRAQGGLGIGLALVRQLVELHQGSVEVVSEGEGMGSTFIVRLPFA
jgi:signal transduction histidine kinase